MVWAVRWARHRHCSPLRPRVSPLAPNSSFIAASKPAAQDPTAPLTHSHQSHQPRGLDAGNRNELSDGAVTPGRVSGHFRPLPSHAPHRSKGALDVVANISCASGLPGTARPLRLTQRRSRRPAPPSVPLRSDPTVHRASGHHAACRWCGESWEAKQLDHPGPCHSDLLTPPATPYSTPPV
jgi:hypothetical protein